MSEAHKSYRGGTTNQRLTLNLVVARALGMTGIAVLGGELEELEHACKIPASLK
jgi:hypothetical protein